MTAFFKTGKIKPGFYELLVEYRNYEIF